MRKENANLLLGLGVGALVGVAVGYLLTAENRMKLEENISEVGHGIKEGVNSMFSKAKTKADHYRNQMANKAEEWSERADEWTEKACDKASEVADEVSKKAGEMKKEKHHA